MVDVVSRATVRGGRTGEVWSMNGSFTLASLAEAEEAHARCPVSKVLTAGGEDVTIRRGAWGEP
jgi:hypothetical protein